MNQERENATENGDKPYQEERHTKQAVKNLVPDLFVRGHVVSTEGSCRWYKKHEQPKKSGVARQNCRSVRFHTLTSSSIVSIAINSRGASSGNRFF